MRHQSSSHGHHLLLTTGQRPGFLTQTLLDPGEKLEDVLEVLFEVLVVVSEIGADLEILFDSHPLEEAFVLRDHRHPGLHSVGGGPAPDILTV